MDQIIQPNKETNKKNILIYSAIAVLIGLFLGYCWGTSKAGEPREVMLQEIFSDALFGNNLPGEILGIAPDKKSLTIGVSGIRGVNLPNGYQKKQVLVDENTKVILKIRKDATILEKEKTELKGSEGMSMLLPYVKQEVKIADLVVGDAVNFDFLQDQDANILSLQFIATQINVNR